MLSIAVGGGLCALFLASALVVLAARSAFRTRGALRIALVSVLLVWAVTSLTATVEENRTTWLLFGMIVVAGRLAGEDRRRAGRLPFCEWGVLAFFAAHSPARFTD